MSTVASPDWTLTCNCCHRPFPRTALELWMQQHGYTYRTLAAELGIAYGILFRLNHQPPGFTPGGTAAQAQEKLLRHTGLVESDLRNTLPKGGYAYGKGSWQVYRKARAR